MHSTLVIHIITPPSPLIGVVNIHLVDTWWTPSKKSPSIKNYTKYCIYRHFLLRVTQCYTIFLTINVNLYHVKHINVV